jgi:hypothetical protein
LIAYVTNRTGANEVYVRGIAGDREVQVSSGGGEEPVWSRDGAELFYRSPSHMMVSRLARLPQLSVSRRDSLFPEDRRYLRNASIFYDVFPDGREFVMVRPNVRGEELQSAIVIRFNWHAAKRANEDSRGR